MSAVGSSSSKKLATCWVLLQHVAIAASAFAATSPAIAAAPGTSAAGAPPCPPLSFGSGCNRFHRHFGIVPSSSSSTSWSFARYYRRSNVRPSYTTNLFSTRGGDDGTEDSSPDDDDDNEEDDNNDELRTVLVTGGTGYIGSHTCLELLGTGRYRVVVVDNLENSSEESLNRVRELLLAQNDNDDDDDGAGKKEEGRRRRRDRLHFRECDIRDAEGLRSVLREFPSVSGCVHFAGLKAVGESVARPLDYYGVNVGGTTTLLRQLTEANVNRFVFSSSATVYGEPEALPLREDARLSATNPYGRTKLFIEEILRDLYASRPDFWKILILRYFNPIGAHPSGRMGEDPQGIPNNLMPFIAQVCVGRREKLSVFGDDYDTPDGTGVRDYIHVVDLAKGHVAALDRLYSTSAAEDGDETAAGGGGGCCEAVNLGTGHGVSVLQLVEGMGKATGKPVPYEISARRPGDVAELYADPTKAKEMLGWEAALGTEEMCEDTWRWQSTNPMGYRVVVEEKKEEEIEIVTKN